jgi:capsular polysaccharide biosynthesis protein|tara:strand:- start:252 stop:1391 length:1140 start_codon:yes stop_codon:yes gene_type:complete
MIFGLQRKIIDSTPYHFQPSNCDVISFDDSNNRKNIIPERKIEFNKEDKTFLKLSYQNQDFARTKHDYRNGYVQREVYYKIINDCVIYGDNGTVLQRPTNNLIAESGFDSRRIKSSYGYNKIRVLRKNKLDNRIYLSMFHIFASRNNYYHWLIDHFSKLFVFTLLPKDDYVLLLNDDCSQFQIDSLSYFIKNFPKVEIKFIPSNRCFVAPRTLIVSSISWHQNGWLPEEVIKFLKKLFIQQYELNDSLKIYIKRGNRRTIVNESILIQRLKELGYKIVLNEKLSFSEQIDLYKNASIVIGTHGAGLSNVLFSPQGSMVVELFPNNLIKPHYFFLSKSLQLNYHYFLGTALSKSGNKSFSIDVDKFLSFLDEINIGRKSY